MNVIKLKDHGIVPGEQDSYTARLNEVLLGCADATTLHFEPGTYHFNATGAAQAHYFVSNNQAGLKTIIFHLKGRKSVHIRGHGARFIFHGAVVPFVIDDCEDITLSDFSIDWERPFYSQGEIVDVADGSVDLAINSAKYPYHFVGDQIVFDGEDWSHGFSEGVFEMDRATKAPAFLSGDNLGGQVAASEIRAQALGAGMVRLSAPFTRQAKVGNILLLRHFKRLCPAIFMQCSQSVLLEEVSLYHSGAMGVIGQYCEDVTMRRLRVEPTPGTDRYFSVTVDASHFVNCRGTIRLKDCFFENQMDDPCNVHGMNSRISEVLDERTVRVERVHVEQRGITPGFTGDEVQISSNVDLLNYHKNQIRDVRSENPQFAIIVFEETLPAGVRPGHVVENMTWTAAVEITGCTSGKNRARGYLLSTPRKVLLADNHISAAGAGVKISGDANYWFESGAVRDITIKNNRFGDCCYGPIEWGRAVIDIDPEITDPWDNRRCFHRNIKIEENHFQSHTAGVLYARSVDQLSFKKNWIGRSGNFPATHRMPAEVVLDACENYCIEENAMEAGGAPLLRVNAEKTSENFVIPQESLS